MSERPTRVIETYKAYPQLQKALPEIGCLIVYIEQLEAERDELLAVARRCLGTRNGSPELHTRLVALSSLLRRLAVNEATEESQP